MTQHHLLPLEQSRVEEKGTTLLCSKAVWYLPSTPFLGSELPSTLGNEAHLPHSLLVYTLGGLEDFQGKGSTLFLSPEG